MSPEQALQTLAQASSLANMTLQDHSRCQEAIRILSELVKPKEEALKK
jgi:hypothetical protein